MRLKLHFVVIGFLGACGQANDYEIDATQQSQQALWFGVESMVSAPSLTTSFRTFVDISGDGLDDECGFLASNGSETRNAQGEFVVPMQCAVRSRATHAWGQPRAVPGLEGRLYGDVSIRRLFGDLNADGRTDICGVIPLQGFMCSLNSGVSFAPAQVWQPSFTAANGWAGFGPYAPSIHFVKTGSRVFGLIARGRAGLLYYTSSGSAFRAQPAQTLTEFSDANGWSFGASHYGTFMAADISGDGVTDVCARGNDGILCSVFDVNRARFGPVTLWTTQFRDRDGWVTNRSETLRLVDVDRDGKADVCGVGSAGVYCGYSNGSTFDGASALRASGLTSWVSQDAFNDCHSEAQGIAFTTDLLLRDVTGDGFVDACVARYNTGGRNLPMSSTNRIPTTREVWCAEGFPNRVFAPFRLAATGPTAPATCWHALENGSPEGRWDGRLDAPQTEATRRGLCFETSCVVP